MPGCLASSRCTRGERSAIRIACLGLSLKPAGTTSRFLMGAVGGLSQLIAADAWAGAASASASRAKTSKAGARNLITASVGTPARRLESGQEADDSLHDKGHAQDRERSGSVGPAV